MHRHRGASDRGDHARRGGAARRRARYRHGLLAETLAMWRLRLAGWRILDRRCRTPLGEIDIVARRGGTLAFVEVKQRRTWRDAAAAVSPRQRRRILGAARCWLAMRPAAAMLTCRFDVVIVNRYMLPRHLPDAFRPDEMDGGHAPWP